MDGVKLMDRTDTKFTFHRNQLNEILTQAQPYYKALEIEGNRVSQYHTLYYDTNELDLYLKHHSGKLNRYKIRHRTYVDSSLGFLEVKFKNNKGRTIKERIKKKQVPSTWDADSETFLNDKLPFDPKNLYPVVWVNYKRLTLVNKATAERLTIDLDLEFKKGEETINLTNLVIAEVKQEKKNSSPFLKIMKEHHIREGSISKYCMAISFTYPDVKKNNFKQKLRNLNTFL